MRSEGADRILTSRVEGEGPSSFCPRIARRFRAALSGGWDHRRAWQGRLARVLPCAVVLLCLAPLAASAEDVQARAGPHNADRLLVTVPKRFPPHYQLDQDGQPEGFAIDVANEIAKLAGLRFTFRVEDSWQDAYDALREGNADLIPNLGISDARKHDYDFTAPLETFRISIFVRKRTEFISDIDDLKGRKVAVVRTNVATRILQKMEGVELVLFDDPERALFSLLSAQVDAMAYPDSVFWSIARQARVDGRVKMVGDALAEIRRAMAVKKGNDELLQRLDKAVRVFVGTPEYRRIYTKWYGKPTPFWNTTRALVAIALTLALSLMSFLAWRYVILTRHNRELRSTIAEREQAEHALATSERYNRMLFEQSPIGLALTRMDGELVDVNPAYAKIMGRSVDETMALSHWEITPKKYQPDEATQLESLKEVGRYGPYEKEFIHKDGHLVPVRLSGLIVERDGEQFIWSSVEDISARKQAEAALHESESRFRAVFQEAGMGIALVDLQGHTIYSNPALQAMLGYSGEELAGKLFSELTHPEDSEKDKHFYRELIAGERESYRMERHYCCKDGKTVYAMLTVTLVRDEQGQPEFSIGMVEDITERKQAEQALDRSRAEFKAMFDSLSDAVIYADTQRRILLINPAVTQIFGYGLEELAGHTTEMLYADPSDYTEQGRRRFNKDAAATGEVYHMRYRRKDGSVFIGETLGAQLNDGEGNLLGFMGVVRDITDRKAREEELRQHREHLAELVEERTAELSAVNKELEAFSYSVSHDLRAPLRAIDGFSHALADDYGAKLDATGQSYLTRIRKGAQKMALLIDDMLQLSKVARRELQVGPVDLTALAEKLVNQLRDAEPAREVDIRITPGVHGEGDATLLQVVLQNLLDNAWKYTAKTTSPVIEFGQTEKNGTPVYYVRDNGAGFDMRYADKLFGAFQRLHRPDEFEGTGVGLATVQRVINRHGGRAWAQGEVNKGATFYFTLG